MELYTAADNGDLERVQMLVEQGVNIDMTDTTTKRNYTPLFVASRNGHLEVVRYLLEQGANRDKTANNGWTSLHNAAIRGHLDIVKLLMDYGADLNARTIAGHVPIDMAATEEIKQAIRDEPRRRMDEAPGKRATEQDRHPNAAALASAQGSRSSRGTGPQATSSRGKGG